MICQDVHMRVHAWADCAAPQHGLSYYNIIDPRLVATAQSIDVVFNASVYHAQELRNMKKGCQAAGLV